ncbi:PREDICTED: potassium channel AKT1-like [Lupinus angustifolius]|uniref:potassium channel AKT1-like n=1 Tax=Lupinus angustifolius TaxID=3871 RepID=UPI00092F401C|nr:PREDICTED: potassium channel AKT1-like [Lupinus angustifolius]
MLDSIPEELRINILQRLYGPLISGNEVLHDISNEGYIKWVPKLIIEHHPREATVISLNQICTHFYILVSGEVELLSEDENGSVHRVVLLANSLLGEVGVLYCERHPFTIRTRTLSHMVKVNRKTIIDIGMTHADDIRLIMTNHCQYLSQHPIMKRASEMRRYTLTRPPIDLPLTLCSAVSATGDDDGLVTRLLQWGWDVNERDETGKSALYLAVSMTKTRRLNCLLENGADPNIKDFNGKLPLWEALQHGDKPMRDTLIRYGTILEERVKDEYAHSSNALNDNNLMDEILHYDVTLPTIASIVEECHEYECSVHIRDPYMEERRRYRSKGKALAHM